MRYNCDNILVLPSTSIQDTLKVIDSQDLRTALIADENRKLLGIVTDGDIRRALLKKVSLNSPVSIIMNKSPIKARLSTPTDELNAIMQLNNILVVPLIDNNGCIMGLEALVHQNSSDKRKNPIFIMAGGFGTRLSPLTDNCPKPLLKVGDKPLLEIIIQNFIKAGFVNFYISTHYMSNMIEDYFGDGNSWGVKIRYVHEDSPLGTGGALGLLPHDIEPLPLILINGDVLTNIYAEKILDFHERSGACSTMCVREYSYNIPYGVIENDGHYITHMTEKPTYNFYVNAGIYVIEPHIYLNVPPNIKVDLPDLLRSYKDKGENLAILPIHEYWLDIGQLSDFERAQKDILELNLL